MATSQKHFVDHRKYLPDVEHITELNSSVSCRENSCEKSQYHKEYITMDRFSKLCPTFSNPKTSRKSSPRNGESLLLEGIKANNKLHEFLNCMSFLTGIIKVKHGKCQLTFWERSISFCQIIKIILWRLLCYFLKKGYIRKSCQNLKQKYTALRTGYTIGRLSGSGFVQKVRRVTNKPCPCPVCAKRVDPERRYAIVTITTVLHVFDKDCSLALVRGFIKEKWRAENTKVKLFYNREEEGEDEDKTEDLYGYRLLETDKEINIESDWCAVECVTHNMRLVGKLEQTLENYMTLQGQIYEHYIKNISTYKARGLEKLVVIIGHPHGGPKKMSVGTFDSDRKVVLKEVRNYQRWCSYEYDNITCCGSSGSPVFILGQALCGFGYWFGHPHNHSKAIKEDEKGGNSSLGVECL